MNAASKSYREMNYSHWAMTCLIFSQANYTHMGLCFRFLKSITSSTGIAISSAIHTSLIPEYLVEHFGNRCFQFLPESLANTVKADWQNIYLYPGFGDIPVSIANRDTYVLSSQHPFSGCHITSQRRIRKLDDFIDSNRRVEILHIAEPVFRVLDILAGSQVLISRDQPALLIEVNASGNIADLALYLEKLNYVLLDSSLQPVLNDQNQNIHATTETETFFLGLSNTFLQLNGLPRAFWPKNIQLANHNDWQRALIAGFTKEARSGGIQFGKSLPVKHHYKFNDQLLCQGFYTTEQDNGHEWRWLGPKPSASIWFAKPQPGRYSLKLSVIGAQAEAIIDNTRLFLNGVLLIVHKETVEGGSYLIASIEILDDEATLTELGITVPSTYRASPDDQRMLGICVSHLELVAVAIGD